MSYSLSLGVCREIGGLVASAGSACEWSVPGALLRETWAYQFVPFAFFLCTEGRSGPELLFFLYH
jgi:hypothetical protein